MEAKKNDEKMIETMFGAGAHFGLGRSRRHPTVSPFIFSTKNKTDIFDLEKTQVMLEKTLGFVSGLAKEDKTILFVGSKKEAITSIQSGAQSISMPYVNSRFIGGTLTNFGQIRKRIELFERLVSDREKGELAKYTKHERLLIDKDITALEHMFGGIVSLKKLPAGLFIVDPRREKNAVKEASDLGIPVIALASSDCDISDIDYVVLGNDASRDSIR
ncbi:MAG: 30S ribosomal protein S2, partial [Candidatus Taylorbacteria bacterium RIFCSPHIGHO2_02_FULL_44_12]